MNMMEEICYYCRYSQEWGYDGLGWCFRYRIKKLVREERTCEDFEEDCEPIDDEDEEMC